MPRAHIRTRTRRESLPTISPAVVAAALLIAEFALFAVSAGQASMVIRSFVVALPLLIFIARAPVVGVYAIAFLIPLELFARIPNEFFSLYKLLGLFTLTSAAVHWISGDRGLAGQRTGLHRWVGLFLFLTACSVLWSIEPEKSLQAVRRLVSLAVFYWLTIRLVNTRSKLRGLVIAVIVSCVIAAAFAIAAYVQGDAVFDTQTDVTVDDRLRASGASLDANFFAATILTALPFCLLGWRTEKGTGARAFLAAAAIAIVAGTVFSFSRGGALTMVLVLALAYFAALRRMTGKDLLGALLLVPIVFGIGFLMLPSAYRSRVESLSSPIEGDESIRGRWLYVEFGREAVFESPLGVGAGAFPIAFAQSSQNQEYRYYGLEPGEQQGRSAHNMYLEVSVEMGLLGGFLFFCMIVFALYESRRVGRHLDEKDDAFLATANAAVAISLAGFAFSGLFLSAQYEKTLWLFLALVPTIKNLSYEGEVFVPDMRKLRRALARRGKAI